MGEATVYHIMHTEKCVAQVSTTGECKIYLEDFMPYDLVLEESDDFDDRINNVTNFYYWCASRMLTLDRTYAKEILNSIGASQNVTDRERAQIALSYHCLSLLDVILKRGCAERMASIFIKMADRMQSSVRYWQVKSVDALTVIRFCMSKGCLRTSQFPSVKS